MSRKIHDELHGVIIKVTGSGRYAEVELKRPHRTLTGDYRFGLINDQTQGRIQMMVKDPSQVLVEGKEVRITCSQPINGYLQILELKT